MSKDFEYEEFKSGGRITRSKHYPPFFVSSRQRKSLCEHRQKVDVAMLQLSGDRVSLNNELLDFHQFWRSPKGTPLVLVVPLPRSRNYAVSAFDSKYLIPEPNQAEMVFAQLVGDRLNLVGILPLSSCIIAKQSRRGSLGPYYLQRKDIVENDAHLQRDLW